MSSRRHFLQVGITASALPFALTNLQALPRSPAGAAAPANELPGRIFYKVIVDDRIPESLRFGQRMREMGSAVHAISGDVTDLWFHDLFAQWTKEPVAIAGLTEHGPLFCLERLAWDHRMRVVYRAEHRFDGDCVLHEITGPEAVIRRSADLGSEGVDWTTHAARLVGRCQNGRSPTAVARAVTHVAPAGAREPLLSWVIAPRA